jgi:outer membrane receptor protein involved in Fe transport
MTKGMWFLSAAVAALAAPAMAQETPAETRAAPQDVARDDVAQGDIVVTATRRSQALPDVPLAVSAVSAETLQNSGATDIRQLNQLSPSLLVSSTTSEAGAAVARIRGIGTVGDNPGLESSVAVFIDGVYRSRTGTGLTELGAIDRIEVLRGPQGTLFGRNTSAGLIHVITAQPSFEEAGTAELSYGNFDYWRGQIGLTGPVSEKIAYRIDGVYTKRDGFMTDVVSGRDVNDRDRWIVRGQLLLEPSERLSVRIIGDYADRDEECCAAVYLTPQNFSRNPDGTIAYSPSTMAGLIRLLAGRADAVGQEPFARETAITPGRSYRSDVRDWGLSAELNYELGDAKLTSITAYRDWLYIRGQDADFNPLDLVARPDDGGYRQSFKTFTQELRLQGESFGGKLDWLIGGYFANEKLSLDDNLAYGADYGRFYSCLVTSQIPGAFNPAATLCNGTPGLPQLGPAGGILQAALTTLGGINGADSGIDRYRQDSRNYALFTHNEFKVTDRLSLTAGLRYTNERKKLDASFNGSPAARAACFQNAAALAPLASTPLAPVASGIQSFSCAPIAPVAPGTAIADTKKEDQFTGTAVISFKASDQLLTYASYSKGYKAGGFNLDRAPLLVTSLTPGAVATGALLRFEPETVDAFEIGAKYNGRGFDLNVAAFYQMFDSFQLNTFSGTNFVVLNVEGCSQLAGGDASDSDAIPGNSACTGKTKSGVVTKGVEIEAFLRPLPFVMANLGFTFADAKFRSNVTGTNGASLPTGFFQVPGSRLANAARYTMTGAFGWTPPIGNAGLSALVYADFRHQSKINTGSDLDLEKIQKGLTTVNARLGLRGPEERWSIEFWAQNLFDVDYQQIAFDAPVQPGGAFNTVRGVQQGFQPSPGTQLFTAFLAEPRTYGVTVRTKF